MTEQVEIAPPAYYHIELFFEVGAGTESRTYYTVSEVDKEKIVNGWQYGYHVTFNSRGNATNHIKMDRVYAVRVEPFRSDRETTIRV